VPFVAWPPSASDQAISGQQGSICFGITPWN